MKKLLLFLVAGLLFQACSSDSPIVDEPAINPEATLYDVTFDVKDFDVTTKSTAAITNNRYLKYRVYYRDILNTARNFELIAKEGLLIPAEFNGKISLKLPQGVYTIVAFSSDKAIGDYIDLRTPPKNELTNYSNTGIPYNDLTQEMFRGEADFSIGETSVSKTIAMGRLICKINLALDDFSKIPSNVQSLAVMINCTPAGFSLDGLSQFLTGDEYIENQEIVANGTPNTNNSYFRIAIPKDQIANYSSLNPFSFYFPGNQIFMYPNNERVEAPRQGHSLYLIGFDKDVRVSKTAKVVYKKLIQRNFQTVGNLSLTITGSVLKDAMGISVNEIWDETREFKF